MPPLDCAASVSPSFQRVDAPLLAGEFVKEVSGEPGHVALLTSKKRVLELRHGKWSPVPIGCGVDSVDHVAVADSGLALLGTKNLPGASPAETPDSHTVEIGIRDGLTTCRELRVNAVSRLWSKPLSWVGCEQTRGRSRRRPAAVCSLRRFGGSEVLSTFTWPDHGNAIPFFVRTRVLAAYKVSGGSLFKPTPAAFEVWRRGAWRPMDIGARFGVWELAGNPDSAWAVDGRWGLIHFSPHTGQHSRLPLPPPHGDHLSMDYSPSLAPDGTPWLTDAGSTALRVCNARIEKIKTPCRQAGLTWVGNELWVTGVVDRPVLTQACLYRSLDALAPRAHGVGG